MTGSTRCRGGTQGLADSRKCGFGHTQETAFLKPLSEAPHGCGIVRGCGWNGLSHVETLQQARQDIRDLRTGDGNVFREGLVGLGQHHHVDMRDRIGTIRVGIDEMSGSTARPYVNLLADAGQRTAAIVALGLLA